jgi:hypothetical protein
MLPELGRRVQVGKDRDTEMTSQLPCTPNIIKLHLKWKVVTRDMVNREKSKRCVVCGEQGWQNEPQS